LPPKWIHANDDRPTVGAGAPKVISMCFVSVRSIPHRVPARDGRIEKFLRMAKVRASRIGSRKDDLRVSFDQNICCGSRWREPAQATNAVRSL
jgi:hypothetical protein